MAFIVHRKPSGEDIIVSSIMGRSVITTHGWDRVFKHADKRFPHPIPVPDEYTIKPELLAGLTHVHCDEGDKTGGYMGVMGIREEGSNA